jgi:hypothetical protein
MKQPFEVVVEGSDFSGMSFEGLVMKSQDRSFSFFNGADLLHCDVIDSDVRNTELSEAHLSHCTFVSSDLSGSDFIGSTVINTTFRSCTFKSGEWRESQFQGCQFVECSFEKTTLTLCTFEKCAFDNNTYQTLQGRSTYLNTFTECDFPVTDNRVFLSRNFGLKSGSQQSSDIVDATNMSLERLTYLRNTGGVSAQDIYNGTDSLFGSMKSYGRRAFSAIKYVELIIKSATEEGKLSATSLVVLEAMIIEHTRTIVDPKIFNSAMSLVIALRSQIYDLASTTSLGDILDEDDEIKHILMEFKESFTDAESQTLVYVIEMIARLNPGMLVVSSVKRGSTIIEVISTALVAAGPALLAINYALKQATVTVKEARKLADAFRRTPKKRTSTGSRKLPSRKSSKTNIVASGGKVTPEIGAIRDAAKEFGQILLRFDTSAKIVITIENRESRGK